MKTPFFSPAYVARSTNVADSVLINLYGEIVETRNGKAVGSFYMTPGLDLLQTVGIGPIYGFGSMQDVLYVVSGIEVYAISPALVVTLLGTLPAEGPVSIIENGTQLAIFDGQTGANPFVIDAATQTLTEIFPPFSGGVSASYQDGFGLVNQVGTNVFWQSNLFDLKTWDPLNFSSADATASPIISIHEIHREQWLFKQDGSVEVWINAGLPGFAFQRLQGVFPETGCAAAFSVSKVGEALMWLSRNHEGQGQIVAARGYQPAVVSTPWVDREIASYAAIDDAVSYSYQQDGHLFYVITFPTGNATWVYDATASALAGVPMWHQRASFSNGQFNRHRGSRHILWRGQHLLGDYQNGNIYVMNLGTQTDDGAPRKWVRTWRALPQPQLEPVSFSALQIDMQTGIDVPQGTDPQVMLRWSDDGGHKWSNYRVGAAGKPGETARRIKFNRLGSTRRSSGLDRIFELSSTDPFGVALIGADLI